MDVLLLVVILLFCALQSVMKKIFNLKVKSGGVFFFAGISSFFAMLFFIISANELSLNMELIPHALGFGISYLVSLVFGYLALATGSASLSSLISSYSLMIPAFYGLIFLSEPVGKFFIPGLLVLVLSIFLINKKTDDETPAFTPRWIFYVVLSFLGGGMCSVAQKMQQVAFDGMYKNEFMITALAFVVISLAIITVIKEREGLTLYIKKGWLTGSVCGIMNGVVNLFVMILSGRMSVSVMFPVIGAGSLIITYTFFKFMFGEKLTKPQMKGFVLGTISIILLNI